MGRDSDCGGGDGGDGGHAQIQSDVVARDARLAAATAAAEGGEVMGKQRRPRQRATGYSVRSMPIIDVEHTPIDLSYRDEDDGTITASFDTIPGAYICADTLAMCGTFLERVVRVVKQQLVADIQAVVKLADGGTRGATSLGDLETRGLQTRLIDDAYCTWLLGMPGAMFVCQDIDALGALISLLLQLAMASHRADKQKAEQP